MTEAFLFHAWQCRLFNNNQLFTFDGEPLQILHPGLLNTDSGPDFINARIRIGETLWAGNVEIHVKASDWKKHDHSKDHSYSNIILHVVFDGDEVVKRPDGTDIPVLILKDKLDENAWKNYQHLINNMHWIPCAGQLNNVPEIVFEMQLNRMLSERMERKTHYILLDLKANSGNWGEIFYRYLARNFGFKINAVPFELVAKALPENILARHSASLFQTEAMLFGTAGMLHEQFKEEYPHRLKEEYYFLKSKFKFNEVDKHLWKFLRLRPANFPTIRLAQFSALMIKSQHLFSKILDTNDLNTLVDFLTVEVSPYWKNHFSFRRQSIENNKSLGKFSIHNILINTIIPFLFIYGNQKGLSVYRERALDFLDHLPPEKNGIISNWSMQGISAKSATHSQGLLELKNNYCQLKKCLQCSIGNKILRNV